VPFHFNPWEEKGIGPRTGSLATPHGKVATPAFMPVATRGMLRGISPARVRPLGGEILLSNAFHLAARPGVEAIQAMGGIHKFLGWNGPILTDSGGFQVFSMGASSRIHDGGVQVEHPVQGGFLDWTPELAFRTQASLGPDIAMVLDVCPPRPGDRDEVASAVKRTLSWSRIQADLHRARGGIESGQALFAIVQGGTFPDLREECARALLDSGFDGFAVGGVSVGEGHEAMMAGVDLSIPWLPPDKIRYLMGVGAPRDLVEAVARGVDLFDCVFPTRSGRFGTALTWKGRLHLLNARFKADPSPIDPDCPCEACASGVPRGALRAGFQSKELLPPILVSTHNLHFILDLMARMRDSISAGEFEELRARVGKAYPAEPVSVG